VNPIVREPLLFEAEVFVAAADAGGALCDREVRSRIIEVAETVLVVDAQFSRTKERGAA
jgi:hypothetical protein